MIHAYTRTMAQMVEGMAEFNQATIEAIAGETHTDDTEDAATATAGEDRPEWDSETPDEQPLSVGDRVTFSKPIDEADIEQFAAVSGDTNPLHLDEEFATETRFGGPIAHGLLASGTISAALARLPGTVVYLSQDLEFLAPVEPGSRVTADCEVIEALGNDQFRLTTTVSDGDDVVIDGEAIVLCDGEA